jgi:hypothetical protein
MDAHDPGIVLGFDADGAIAMFTKRLYLKDLLNEISS